MRTSLLFALKALFGGGLLFLVASRIPLADSFSIVSTLNADVLVTAVVLYFLAHGVSALKLQLFLPGVSLWQATRFTMIGLLYGFALPGQISGDVVKAVRLARASGDAGSAIAAVAVDRIVGLFALFLLMALAIAVDPRAFSTAMVAALAACIVAAIAALGIVLFFPLPAWLGRFGVSVAGWRTLSITPLRLSNALALGLIFQALCVAICMVLGSHLNIDFPLAAWTVVVGFSGVALMAPVTVAGIGVREASLVAAIGYLGGSEVGAFALSLVLFSLTLLGAGVGLVFDLADRDRA
ncbi:MAG: lysylphosphatidylglycerol synthase transmembrane domain-containing protein [Rhodospirillaceae bacterium]